MAGRKTDSKLLFYAAGLVPGRYFRYSQLEIMLAITLEAAVIFFCSMLFSFLATEQIFRDRKR